MLTLNIGLAKIDAPKALAMLFSMGITPQGRPSFVQSDSEPTMVIDTDASRSEVYRLAVHLGEDCIAAWDPAAQIGFLEGPRSEEWGGRFDPRYFFTKDGKRLEALDA